MIKDKDRFEDYKELTEEKVKTAIENAAGKIKKNIDYFDGKYPPPVSDDNVYPIMNYRSWVEGFYTGELWLCYELTNDKCFLEAGEKYLADFKTRIETKDGVDSHDLGFLYTLSCVAQYKLTGNETAKETAIKAARHLIGRFHEKGQFIQAWGELGDENEYRLIVDCLLNIPLLEWVYEETGEESFKKIADAHCESTRKTAIREDGSTYHTYFFDKESGLPKCGKTHQGYKDESAWARGQAWCIYGFMINYHYTKNEKLIPDWFRVTDYFLNNLPEDKIAYWDLSFTSGSEPRDASANLIAACGMLEGYRQGVCGEKYLKAAKSMINTVVDKCLADSDSNGIVAHTTYHRDDGADECSLWGDYYYMEALARLSKDWKMYW